jgi:hypothetical protein
MRIPVIGAIDINQTTWRQFGCFAAMPDHVGFRDVIGRQQRRFVPSNRIYFGQMAASLVSWV